MDVARDESSMCPGERESWDQAVSLCQDLLSQMFKTSLWDLFSYFDLAYLPPLTTLNLQSDSDYPQEACQGLPLITLSHPGECWNFLLEFES